MLKINSKLVKKTANTVIKKIAVVKADSNCMGFMYEPKKLGSLVRKEDK